MKKPITIICVLTIFSLVFFLWWKNGLSPVNFSDKTTKIFVIQKGEGVREIANTLKKEKLIRDPIVFFLLIKKLNLDNKIQAGDFRLSSSMTAEEIAGNLTHGIIDIWVTIPEGKRAEEIAEILKEKIPSYKLTWREILNSQEGYLFPDTYLIPKDADINFIVSMMKNNFENKILKLNLKPKDIEKTVIIASLIEREAKFDDDRPLVSSVIHNRLEITMSLQIDATVQYAIGYQPSKKNWWKVLTPNDLKINSPYNTYKNPGLPPTAICNPGLASLKAAVNPAKTNYLYYISDKSGHNHYAKTLEEHNLNIKKYGL